MGKPSKESKAYRYYLFSEILQCILGIEIEIS